MFFVLLTEGVCPANELRQARQRGGWDEVKETRFDAATTAVWRGASPPDARRERPKPVGTPVSPSPWQHGPPAQAFPCASLVHPLYIWTFNVNVGSVATAVLHGGMAVRRVVIPEGSTADPGGNLSPLTANACRNMVAVTRGSLALDASVYSIDVAARSGNLQL